MGDLHNLNEPLDLVRLCLAEPIFVKCKGDRTITGTLHAYDIHLNMLLSDAEEILVVEAADSGSPATAKKETLKRQFPLVFVRGDAVILISSISSSNQ